MKLLIIILLCSSSAFGQVTPTMLHSTVDSLSATLDSITTKTALATTGSMVTLDTLALPVNSSGLFTVIYFSYDTAGHFTGKGMQIIGVDRIGTVYSAPEVIYSSPYYSSGLTTHQLSYTVELVNGLPVILGNGYGSGKIIRWHLMKEGKISPL
jgi:hypothetical protein